MKKQLMLAAGLLFSLPLSALAHPGDHTETQFFHLFTSPYHVAALVGVIALGTYFLVRRKKKEVRNEKENN